MCCAYSRSAFLLAAFVIAVPQLSRCAEITSGSDGSLVFVDVNQTVSLNAVLSRLSATEALLAQQQALLAAVIDCTAQGRTFNTTLGICNPVSCNELFKLNPALPSGVYKVGAPAVSTYCEMSAASGGWTLIAMQSNSSDAMTLWTYNSNLWTDNSTYNSTAINPTVNANMKSIHFSTMTFSKIRFVMGNLSSAASSLILNVTSDSASAFFRTGIRVNTTFGRSSWIRMMNVPNTSVWIRSPFVTQKA